MLPQTRILWEGLRGAGYRPSRSTVGLGPPRYTCSEISSCLARVCMCVYACMWMCACVGVHACGCVHVRTCMRVVCTVSLHVSAYVRVCGCVWIYVCAMHVSTCVADCMCRFSLEGTVRDGQYQWPPGRKVSCLSLYTLWEFLNFM